MMTDEDRYEKLWPFLRGYEKLMLKYGFRLDVKNGELRVFRLPFGYDETPEFYRYLEAVIDRAAKGEIENEILV